MNSTKSSLEEVLQEAFTHLQEPLLFHNMLRDSEGLYEWKLLEWDFSELAEKLGDLKLPFRIGHNARSTVSIINYLFSHILSITSFIRCFRILSGKCTVP